MRTMDGVVTLVQESRFQLTDGEGVSHLFVLSHKAALEPAQLVPLQRTQAPVAVRYEDASNVIALLAHSIALRPDPANPTAPERP